MALLMLFLALFPDAQLCARAVGGVVLERPGRASSAPERATVCLAVVRAARAAGVAPDLAVAVAWRESRFAAGVCSSKGACGPLQAVPRWWCPGRSRTGCDLVAAGARALEHYLGKHQRTDLALCHYACGNTCNAGGRRYAAQVLEMRRWLRASWAN